MDRSSTDDPNPPVEARPAATIVLVRPGEDGLEVLLAQGAASFELWTDLPAPIEVMRGALGYDSGTQTLAGGNIQQH